MFLKHRFIYLFALTILSSAAFSPIAHAEKVDVPDEIAAEQDEVKKNRGEKTFNAESFMLDNGLEVVVVPNTRAPVVTQMVWYKVGSAFEPQGKSGIAHFLEHLMFKGSKQIGGPDLAPGEFSKIIRGIGGQDNAFTSQDYTAYFQSVPAEKLEQVMRMEAGRMRGMMLPPEEVLSERKVIMEERRMRTDNNPQSRFFEQVNARAFPDHPYGVPIIGWMDEIAELTYEDAKSYYKKWYAPNNAILIITGDVTPADVFAKAIDIYGDIEKIELPERDYVSHPEIKAQQKIVTYDPDVREAALIQIYRAPSAIENKQDALALRVLSEILGGGPSSRLYQSLVTRQKLASSISFNYDDLKSANGSIIISATPLPDKTVQRVEKAITAELDTLVNKGISDQELMDAVTRLKDSAVYARDSLSGPAMIIGRAMSVGMSLDDIEYWPHDISTVTKVHVEYVANTYLNPESITPVTGYLLPESKRPEGEKPEAESTKKIETEPETDIEDKIEDEVKDEVEDRAGDVKPDRATEDKSQDMPDQDEDVDAASDEQETTEAKPPTEEEAKTESTSQSAPSHNE